MKQQIILIGGADTFRTYEDYLEFLRNFEINIEDDGRKGWKYSLQEELGAAYEIVIPKMPNTFNARYVEWKIWFDKYVPFMKEGIILIGYSMGGIFLAKYLSENNVPVKIKAVFLVAPPYDEQDTKDALNDFILPESLQQFQNQASEIHIYQSKDDELVPFADLDKYAKQLPQAKIHIFENRGHFWAEEFPELVGDIKKLS